MGSYLHYTKSNNPGVRLVRATTALVDFAKWRQTEAVPRWRKALLKLHIRRPYYGWLVEHTYQDFYPDALTRDYIMSQLGFYEFIHTETGKRIDAEKIAAHKAERDREAKFAAAEDNLAEANKEARRAALHLQRISEKESGGAQEKRE